jgi:hypothetical protein
MKEARDCGPLFFKVPAGNETHAPVSVSLTLIRNGLLLR